ncbi:MAG TPA: EAL domain-containing protein [Beijerinckiaceae bacterium]|jgi:cyclic-di-GMP phosphodiesterase TipF (flagellum assembly factor)
MTSGYRFHRGFPGAAAWAGLGLVGALGVAGAAALLGGASTAAIAAAAAAASGAGLACYRARSATATIEKASQDLDVLSGRLIALEGRVIELDRLAGRDLRTNVAEVTGEIALLGNLVRDLAVTVSGQDRDLAALRQRADAAPSSPAAPRGEAAVQPLPQVRPAPGPEALIAALRGEAANAPPAPSVAPAARAPAPVALDTPARPAPVAAVPRAAEPGPVAPPVREAAPSLDALDSRRLGAVVEAFERDRLELHLQPIVSLPQRKARAYETLARLRLADDSLMTPAEFLPVLERCGLSAELDRRVLARAAAVARHLAGKGSEALVSVNVAPASLAEPGFLRSVGRVLDQHPDVAGRLVLELSQRCWRTLDAERAGALAVLRDRGVPFALDRAADLRLDPLTLAERGVRLLKLPADMLLRPDARTGLDIAVTDLAAVLARAGVRLVAERVEREEDVPDLIDLDVPLGQGRVFAPPRPIRADIVGAPAAAPAPATSQMPVAAPEPAAPAASRFLVRPASAPTEERVPLRSFLRRAG